MPNLIRLMLGDGPDEAVAERARHRGRVILWIERLLVVVGVICLGYYVYVWAEARLYQQMEDKELDSILTSAPPPPAGTTAHHSPPAQGATLGRIDIPRLGVSSVIRVGTDARTLQLAVGFIPGTSLPGELGNVGLAGHRDTFFRKLRDINPDDEIVLTTPDGAFHYFVQRTNIVEPKDIWVLNRTNYPALTLVTCYPFVYVGSAPRRFIVRAALRPPSDASREPVASAKPAALPVTGPPILGTEIHPIHSLDTRVNDSRGVQPQGRLRQDDHRRQSGSGARPARAIGPAGRPGSRHGRVDLGRHPTGRSSSVDSRSAAAPVSSERRGSGRRGHQEPSTRRRVAIAREHRDGPAPRASAGAAAVGLHPSARDIL
jgi:sortase A